MKKPSIRTVVEYILALGLALVTYLFYSMVINTEERYFTVPLQAKIDTRFTFIKKPPRSVTVLLKGSNASLSRINADNISAVIDFSLHDKDGIYVETVEIIRNGVFSTLNTVEVEISPSIIESNIEKKLTKSVKVLPVFFNTPPPEYAFQGFKIIPEEVKISGPRSVVLPIEILETQEINLVNETREFASTVKVINATNVALDIEPEEVEVIAQVQQVITVRTIDEATITVINLSDDFVLITELPKASLIVRGKINSVNNFNPEIVLDAQVIEEAGAYTLIPTVSRVSNVEIISFSPTSVSIEVEANNIDPIESPSLSDVDFPADFSTDEPPASILNED